MTKERIICEACGKTLKTKANLKRHMAVVHEKLKPFKCEHCDFACSIKSNLKAHSCYATKNGQCQEYDIQNKMEKELGSFTICCPIGRVDLMTHDTIIELKKWKDHKKGIGQLMCYSHYFPDKKRRLHFFGVKPVPKQEEAIRKVCEGLGIEVTEE